MCKYGGVVIFNSGFFVCSFYNEFIKLEIGWEKIRKF